MKKLIIFSITFFSLINPQINPWSLSTALLNLGLCFSFSFSFCLIRISLINQFIFLKKMHAHLKPLLVFTGLKYVRSLMVKYRCHQKFPFVCGFLLCIAFYAICCAPARSRPPHDCYRPLQVLQHRKQFLKIHDRNTWISSRIIKYSRYCYLLLKFTFGLTGFQDVHSVIDTVICFFWGPILPARSSLEDNISIFFVEIHESIS